MMYLIMHCPNEDIRDPKIVIRNKATADEIIKVLGENYWLYEVIEL